MGNPRQNQIRTRVQFVVVCLDSLGPTQRTNTKRGQKGGQEKPKKTTPREGGDSVEKASDGGPV